MKLSKLLSVEQITKNFKAMSLLLKILFILGLYSLGSGVFSFVTQQAVEFSYFGTGFPQNSPEIWYVYSITICLLGYCVFMLRSRSLLIKYALLSGLQILVAFANSIYYVEEILQQVHVFPAVYYYSFYIVLFSFASLLAIYPLTQKKYFNQK